MNIEFLKTLIEKRTEIHVDQQQLKIKKSKLNNQHTIQKVCQDYQISHDNIEIDLSIGTTIEVDEDIIQKIGVALKAEEMDTEKTNELIESSSFIKNGDFSSDVKPIELLPHDVKRFPQPITVKLEAAS